MRCSECSLPTLSVRIAGAAFSFALKKEGLPDAVRTPRRPTGPTGSLGAFVTDPLRGRSLDDNAAQEGSEGQFPDFAAFRDLVLIEMKPQGVRIGRRLCSARCTLLLNRMVGVYWVPRLPPG
jgi:hypothetical protein